MQCNAIQYNKNCASFKSIGTYIWKCTGSLFQGYLLTSPFSRLLTDLTFFKVTYWPHLFQGYLLTSPFSRLLTDLTFFKVTYWPHLFQGYLLTSPFSRLLTDLTFFKVTYWPHLSLVTPYGDTRSGSTLSHVMARCLTAPSHYLNQYWVIISKVQ